MILINFNNSNDLRKIAFLYCMKLLKMKTTLSILLIFTFINCHYSQNGNTFLDNSFGTNGTLKFEIGSWGDVLIDSKYQYPEKLIIAGTSSFDYVNEGKVFGMARVNVNGVVDQTFGQNGVVLTKMDSNEFNVCYTFDIKNDKKIILAGTTTYPQKSSLIIQYLENGEIDSSFQQNGVLISNFGLSSNVEVRRIKVLEDNKILIFGKIIYSDSAGISKLFLGRLNENGNIDSTFAENGFNIFSFNINNKFQYAYQVAQFSDGGILIAGSSDSLNSFSLAKFDNQGITDTSFGVMGHIIYENYFNFSDIKIMENNEMFILFSGEANRLVKLHADGSYYQNFGVNGILSSEISDEMSMTTINILFNEKKEIILVGIPKTEAYDYSEVSFTIIDSLGKIKENYCAQYNLENSYYFNYVNSLASIYVDNNQFISFTNVLSVKNNGYFDYYTLAHKINLNDVKSCFYYENSDIIEMYPNPVNKKLSIATSIDLEYFKIEIFNLNGVLVLSENLNKIYSELDVSKLSGFYICKFYENENLLKSFKLVVEN